MSADRPVSQPSELTAWLIERGQPEGQMPIVWWTGHGWTTDAFDAARFDSKEAAEEVIERTFTPPASRGGPSARAVQHGFARYVEGDISLPAAELHAEQIARAAPQADAGHCRCEDHLQARLSDGCRCGDHVHELSDLAASPATPKGLDGFLEASGTWGFVSPETGDVIFVKPGTVFLRAASQPSEDGPAE